MFNLGKVKVKSFEKKANLPENDTLENDDLLQYICALLMKFNYGTDRQVKENKGPV